MYIIFESIPSTDPRWNPNIQVIVNQWHFVIGYIAPEHVGTVNLDLLKATEINEAMAYAHHFTNAVDGEVSIMKNVSDPKDMIQPTSFGDEGYTKVDYKLTSTDELNAIGLLKAMMLNWAENHYTEETGLVQIKAQVPSLTTLKATQMYMATYFEWDCAYTHGKEKKPEFTTPKFTVEIKE